MGCRAAAEHLDVSLQTHQPTYAAGALRVDSELATQCRGMLLDWNQWTGTFYAVLQWHDARKMMLLAQAWRMWFAWHSPLDVVREVHLDRYDVSWTSGRRLESEPFPRITCLCEGEIAQSSLDATVAIYAHVASLTSRSDACRNNYARLRDGYLLSSVARLRRAEYAVNYLEMNGQDSRRMRRFLTLMLHDSETTPVLHDDSMECVQDQCAEQVLLCAVMRSRLIFANDPAACDQAYRCSSTCCTPSLLLMVPGERVAPRLASQVLRDLNASSGVW